MNVIFLFIDGVGIGQRNRKTNPFADQQISIFNHFLSDQFPKKVRFDGLVKSITADLGLEGLPQSATGQTALFTGKNAAEILGYHKSGFPNETLRSLLEKFSIFARLNSAGKKSCFINAYRPIFFEKGPEKLIRYLSVTSIMNWKAGFTFFDFEDLNNKRSIYHDFTNRELQKKGFEIQEFSSEIAGKILAVTSSKFDLSLYEYFLTDRAGHAQKLEQAVNLIIELERFIFTVLKNINLSKTLLILTSDHGNIEDLSRRTHTRNPVPIICWGCHKEQFLKSTSSILDVTPTLVKLFTEEM